MNALSRWETYSPFSVGLEDFFTRLDQISDTGTNFPPYNLIKDDDTHHRLVLAVAGYKRDELEVALEKHVLTVKAHKDNTEVGDYLHRGLATRDFTRSWQLSEDVVVDEVQLEDGLLTLRLRKEVPEELQRKLLPIT